MDIRELKEKISDKSLSDDFMVWALEDYSSYIIAKQYIHAIAEFKHLVIKFIDSFKDIGTSGFVEDSNLYIYKVDKLEEFEPHDNLIIICNKTNYKNKIKIPKLEPWQFVDYLETKLPGMNKADIEWLITQYEVLDSRVKEIKYERLENDLDKIAIFSPALQDSVFNELYTNGEYNTISNLTVFDLSEAMIKKDAKLALEVLKVFDYIDSKPHVWILSILLNNFRNIIGVQVGNNTAEELGISDKQHWVIKKRNCGYYDTKQLYNIYKMLTDVERLYKFGGLTQDMLADYIVCKILGE